MLDKHLPSGQAAACMQATLDHVVLWSDDPVRAVDFYTHVLGLTPVRLAEFQAGTAPFPSVRISPSTILDVMARAAAPVVDAMAGAEASAGHRVNHVCLAMSAEEYQALRGRLEAHGVPMSSVMEQSFGAQGLAPQAFYFRDPDGNVLEARYYQG
jgi:catechol 2,3-dioxygenase-like lactoylglutathione lyase family enzyme